MGYFEKYIKYKTKYENLKNQIGGNIFELLFVKLIMYCFEYNKTIGGDPDSGPNRFVHIKGGSSVKYHMMKYGMVEHENITSDLDLFMVSNILEANYNVETFLQGLKQTFPEYEWKMNLSNGLYIISVNNINIIDITVYNSSYIDRDPENSMFLYGIKKLGFPDYKSYFTYLNTIKFSDIVKNQESLEMKTITTLQLERHINEKGIQIQTNYLLAAQNDWARLAQENLTRAQDNTLSQAAREHAYSVYQRYIYQLSEEYIEKIKNKLARYEFKLAAIKHLLGEQ